MSYPITRRRTRKGGAQQIETRVRVGVIVSTLTDPETATAETVTFHDVLNRLGFSTTVRHDPAQDAELAHIDAVAVAGA